MLWVMELSTMMTLTLPASHMAVAGLRGGEAGRAERDVWEPRVALSGV